MTDSIRQQIRDHIVETWLNGDARGFDDEVDLQLAGILDSFTTLALASHLDETFKIAIEPIEINAETFQTVRSLATLVQSKLEEARGTLGQ